MPTILIGAGGTGTAFAACTALRRYWSTSVRIVVMDINPKSLVSSSVLADQFCQVSPFTHECFQSELLQLLQREKVDMYLPLFPLEIQLAAEMRRKDKLPPETKLLAPDVNACEITGDKYKSSEWLRRNRFPSPRTCLEKPAFESEFYCVKPRMGSGSAGMALMTAAEMESMTCERAFPADLINGVVIQERCDPPEVTVDVFGSTDSTFFRVLCRERLEVKSGVATKVRIYEDLKIAASAERLARELGLTGMAFCFQTMLIRGESVITDINPRPGAATATCTPTGNDFFAALFAQAMGEDPQQFFRSLDGSAVVTRQYVDLLMPL